MTSELNVGWLDQSIAQKTDVDKSDLREALQTLGSEMTGVQADVADKASLSHNHTTDQIIDLDTQLSDRVTREDGTSTRQRLEAPRFSLGGVNQLSGVLTLDASDGLDFDVPLAANVTSIVFDGLGVASDAVLIATILFRQGSSAKTVAFPSNWVWPGGTTVAVGTADKATLYRIASYDVGGTWYVLSANVYGSGSSVIPSIDGDLAYGGMFYGNNFGGAGSLGNRSIRYSSSTGDVEFVAVTLPIYKTGSVTHIRQNNRIDQQGGTGYGTGGCAAFLELRKAKTDGTPDMTGGGLLGKTPVYDPATVLSSDSGSRYFPKLALEAPAAVTAGQDVCVVYRNNTLDSSKYYSANFLINDKPLNPRAGPAWGNRRVYRSLDSGASWSEMKRGGETEPSRGMYVWFGELFYDDGIVHGNPYRYGNANQATTFWPLIDGTNNWARQRFKMRATPDFVAKGVWIRLLSEAEAPTLLVSLYNFGSTLIESVSVPATNITRMTSTTESLVSKILGSPRGNPNAATDDEIKWFKVVFSTPRTLVGGSTYELRLTAGSGSKIRVGPSLNAKRDAASIHNSLEGFDGTTAETYAEYTTDNGGSFTKAVNENGTSFSYDLPILFDAL